MDNFRDFGFATPDGVCKSYAARSGCTVDPAVDPKCLGPVSACELDSDYIPQTLILIW
jgi:hypothetical protein